MPSSYDLPAPSGMAEADEFHPPAQEEVEIAYRPAALPAARTSGVPTRRHIPIVPPGPEVPDPDPTAPLGVTEPEGPRLRAAGPASSGSAPDDLVIAQQTKLDSAADNGAASQVCEPSVAVNEDVVFYTGNWFAAVSLDAGRTFQYIDPATAFPEPPGMSFCCDQSAHYIPQIDTFVWLLQYMVDSTGKNIQRLAFATTEDVRQGDWWTMDIASGNLGMPDLFLDFPDLAVGRNMLYMSTNAFRRAEGIFGGYEWDRSIILRLPLSGIRRGDVSGQVVTSDQNFNFRMAQHCGTRAYWATHQSTSSLRVYTWEEDETEAAYFDVPVATWRGGNGYLSETPDGYNWLGRVDPRVLGGTKAGNILYFAWSADRGGANNRPQPYIQIARINALNLRLLNNLNIWDPDTATAYPALATNARREVGCSYCIGGGERYPGHALSLLTRRRRDIVAMQGERGPSQQRWGDYLTVRRHYPHTRLFAATGYVLKANAGEQDATANYTVFGRREDVEAI